MIKYYYLHNFSRRQKQPATIGNSLLDKNVLVTKIWPTADAWSDSGVPEIHTRWMQEPEEMENWPLIMILVRNGNDDIGGDADGYANCPWNVKENQPPLEVKGGFRAHFSLGAWGNA